MSRSRPLLAVLALCACGRPLDLPVEPAAPRPVFLGELSGLYALSVPLPGQDVGAFGPDIALGDGAFVLHVTNPSGGADPVVAALVHESPRRQPAIPETLGCRILGVSKQWFVMTGLYDASKASDQLTAPIPGGGTLRATRVAGGGAGILYYPMCDGTTLPVRMTRACAFDSALSGVYTVTGGSPGARAVDWALGFRAPMAVGMLWPSDGMAGYPANTKLLFGSYSRFGQDGTALLVPPNATSTATMRCGAYRLTESGGHVDYRLGLAGQGAACPDSPDAAGLERLAATRLSGSQSDECAPVSRGLALAWTLRECDIPRGKFLDVDVVSPSDGSRLHRADVTVAVSVVGGSSLDELPDAPGGVTARYRIPAGPARVVTVNAAANTSSGPVAALPSCAQIP